MLWFIIVIVAHLINALVSLVDKYLLKRSIPDPTAFAFFVGLTSAFVLVLIPFGFTIISRELILLSLLSGAAFVYGLIPLYYTFKSLDISDAAPLQGAMIPIYTLAFSYFVLPETLSNSKLLAFILLVVGGLIIAFRKRKFEKEFIYIQISAALIAISFVLAKLIFVDADFINGLIWTRFGMIGGALLLLLIPQARKNIFSSINKTNSVMKEVFLLDKFAAGIAFLLLLYAINLGSVNLVNALQGVQYVFLMLFVLIFAKKFPFMKEERLYKLGLAQKIFGLGLVFAGLYVLGISL